MQKSIFSFFCFNFSITFLVPLIAIVSSSPVIKKLIEPFCFLFSFKNSLTAAIKQAIEPFISLTPRLINF